MKIFSDGSRCPEICYLNIVPLRKFFFVEKFLMRIFRTGVRTHGANSGTRWEGELKSAAVNNCKWEGTMYI